MYLPASCTSFVVTLLFVSVSGRHVDEAPLTNETSKYRVVLVRHGESEANAEGLFSGWCDVDLTPKGVEEAKHAGATLKHHGFRFDVGHTSYLKRASKTLNIILESLNQSTIEKHSTWRLNERHYGMLTGLNEEVEKKKMERPNQDCEWDFVPPPMTKDHRFYEGIITDLRYREDPEFVDFPSSESLEAAVHRLIPYWTSVIVPQMKEGKRVLIAAHGTLLKGFMFYLEGCVDKEILMSLRVENAAPFVYEFDENLKVVARKFIHLD